MEENKIADLNGVTLKRIGSDAELDDYVARSPYVHYMKTSLWAHFKEASEHMHYDRLGFYRDNVLNGTAMVLKDTWMGSRYLYIPWGPCLDYEDKQLVKTAFALLKIYADQEKVLFLRVDPNVVRVHHTIDGTVVNDGFNHEWVTDTLKDLGYTHKGYGYAYNFSWTNRYTLIVDLEPDLETIYGRFSKSRRTALNRHKVNGVRTRLGTREDLKFLMKFEAMLGAQDGFKPHSERFFTQILDAFGEHAVLYVTEIHFDEAAAGLEKELAEKKYRKDPEARAAKEKEYTRMRGYLNQYGPCHALAAGLFVRYGDMSWDLYTYNDKNFPTLNPVDNLHAFAMADMKEHGVRRYDMVGFAGTADKNDPHYGLYFFKSSFGPEFIEQIGQFDYFHDARGMARFNHRRYEVNRIRRGIWRRVYGRRG
jgi:peptidoglycan pentaglycine glycine transferase (the first glycine)